jgi:hypothetical protein
MSATNDDGSSEEVPASPDHSVSPDGDEGYQGRRRLQLGMKDRLRSFGWLRLSAVAVVALGVLAYIAGTLGPSATWQDALPFWPAAIAATPSAAPATTPAAATSAASPSPSGNRLNSPKASPSASATVPLITPTGSPSSSPPPPPPPPLQILRYEAENATMSQGCHAEADHAGYSGTGFVDYYNATGSNVRWTVNLVAPYQVKLVFRYANGTSNNRPMNIAVNDTVVAEYPFSSTYGWTNWQTQTVTVTLNAGSNVIAAVATSGNGGPNVDYLEIQPV